MPVLSPTTDGYSVSTSPTALIKRALRILGVTDPGENPSAGELKDGLEGYNHLLDSWNSEDLVVPSLNKDTFSTVAGTQVYEIGPGGDCDIPRPSKLETGQVFISASGLDYPALTAYENDRWQEIPDKTTRGIPGVFYYDKGNPVASLSLFPIPDQIYTATIYSWKLLAQIALNEINGVFTLEPGYARAIVFNLALDLADEFGMTASQNAVATAITAKANIKSLNIEPILAACDPALLNRHYTFDIKRGF